MSPNANHHPLRITNLPRKDRSIPHHATTPGRLCGSPFTGLAGQDYGRCRSASSRIDGKRASATDLEEKPRPIWLEDAENGLTDRFRWLLNGLWNNLKNLDQRVAELDHEIDNIAQSNPVAKRLQQLRGIGPMIATALVATVGNAEQFVNGR